MLLPPTQPTCSGSLIATAASISGPSSLEKRHTSTNGPITGHMSAPAAATAPATTPGPPTAMSPSDGSVSLSDGVTAVTMPAVMTPSAAAARPAAAGKMPSAKVNVTQGLD